MGNPAENTFDSVIAETEIKEVTKPRAKNIVFHARPNKNTKDPTHTLCFESKDGHLLCTYSKPHPGLESYCKESGRFYVRQRMKNLQEELKDVAFNSGDPAHYSASINLCKRALPNKVHRTIGYYARCASKYFKMAENPLIVIRGQFADWDQWMNSGRRGRVPVKSVIVSAYLNAFNITDAIK